MSSINSAEALMAFAFGTIGSLLPDVDSSRSKAIELAFTLFAMLSTNFNDIWYKPVDTL